jgi:hypothetical protein
LAFERFRFLKKLRRHIGDQKLDFLLAVRIIAPAGVYAHYLSAGENCRGLL